MIDVIYFPVWLHMGFVCSLIPAQSYNESTAFFGMLWVLSTQMMPKNAVDVDHIILNGLFFNLHSKFWTNLQSWTKSYKQMTFTFEQERRDQYGIEYCRVPGYWQKGWVSGIIFSYPGTCEKMKERKKEKKYRKKEIFSCS